ncbi:MAG: hypothetical protein J6X80_10045 [Lachnospiraceae bacterium]|nr:hypothetical protein [Lachnospiraceae bacterium]
MLEKMDVFFTARVDGYDEHMKSNIEGASKFYHYDTPLTVEHEKEALLEGGFTRVEVLNNWGMVGKQKSEGFEDRY